MNKLAKIVILMLMGSLLTAYTSMAETRYVTDNLAIMLRTSPGNDRKIIAQPKVGTPLRIIKPGKDYTQVVTPGGTKGWVLTRYLSSEIPAASALTRLQEEHAAVVKECDILKQRTSQLDTTHQELSSELMSAQKALETVAADYENLKKESGEFLNLKAKYDKTVKEATEARAKADKVDKELQQLLSSELNTGMIYGSGLIILGFVVGFIVKRPKRRPPLM